MTDLKINKLNEVYIHIECEKGIAQELSDYFTFKIPGFQFTPAFKNRIWDGNIRLFDRRYNTLYFGLYPYVEKFCKDRSYTYTIHSDVNCTNEFSLIEAENLIERLNIPSNIDKRDYQIKSFVNGIRSGRMLLVSPTASGKSFILYLLLRWAQESGYKKGLLIVPSTALVEQMYKDFADYGYDSEKYCHRQYAGKEKSTDKFLTLSTWQSIYTNPPEYFEQFDFVFGDEAHEFKAKSCSAIMSSLVNASLRIGCTGTLDGTQTNKLVLEGLFGPKYQVISTNEMIEQGYAAQLQIKCIVLKHEEKIGVLSKKWKYPDEINYLVSNKSRNNFIKNLTISLKGNTLVLFNLVEKHGKELYRIINDVSKKRKVFFVFGGTDVEQRESVRQITELEKDAIIIASYGTFSRGINIRNLHNIIFASPSKSRIRNLQSIGRSLRIGNNKDEAVLYDISDDLRVKIGDKPNYTLDHFLSRLKIYDDEKFPYKIYNVRLKNE